MLPSIRKADTRELLTLWLTDQVLEVVLNEEQALQALKMAENELSKAKSRTPNVR